MDAVLLHPACQVAKVIAHTGKVPMLRLPLDLDLVLAKGRNSADLFVGGRGKNMGSVATVGRLPATVVAKIGCGCSLLAKTLLEMIDQSRWLAASKDSSEMRSVDYSLPHEGLHFADRNHLAPGFDLS